ncbi:helix-turn-helix domain-containing protein [Nocardia sp. NPDC088792]|uniref:helix-turn-helix domain-containing protein n=1 Tax=Nocardia sp. NPDC088792 TaxID=3364332 RepID=UPI0038065F67
MSHSTTSDEEQVGELVRRLRKERDLTQAQLAERVGCSRSLIQQIENGTRVPPLGLRERLSSALGEQLPVADGDADIVGSDLRMRFNILLGKDSEVIERVLAIAQRLVDLSATRDEVAPLREIAERQLDRAEELMDQIASGTVTVQDWNTINDWLTVLDGTRSSVRTIHTVNISTISGPTGDNYNDRLIALARAAVSVQRVYVLDTITDAIPHEDRLWDQARAGVETILVPRRYAPRAPSVLIFDDAYVAKGEYEIQGRERIASRISSLRHEVQFELRRFTDVYELDDAGKAVRVETLIAQPPLAAHRDSELGEGDCRALFRAELAREWVRVGGEIPAEDGLR